MHGSPPLPLGGRGGGVVRYFGAAAHWASSLQHCRGRRNQEGEGVRPLKAVGATERWPELEEESAEVARVGNARGEEGITLKKTM